MLLLTPRSLFVIQVGWTEPMVLLMFCLCIYCAARRPSLLWIAFGLLLAIKQYTILAAPLLLMMLLWRQAVRTLLKASSVAAIIAIPFIAWNPVSFVRSVVLWQLRQPFRPDALSVAALLDHTNGIRLGMWFCALATIGAMFFAYRKSPRSAFGFVLSLSFVLTVFFATNKQAFCNYYFLVVGLACGAGALSQSSANEAATEIVSPEAGLQTRLAA
jgi:hypothetical protein